MQSVKGNSMGKKDENQQMKKILVSRGGKDDFIIEIPASYKLTFAHVNPASHGSGGYREGHCLRVYEGQALRAVFANVQGFRDLSIPLATKVVRETGSASWTRDSEGNFENTERREVETNLVLEASDEVSW